jgi:hypothetical protein
MTTFPTIHLNGTGKQMLLDGYVKALHALHEAQKAISQIEFNARDYYVQGNEAWNAARDEMAAQFDKLHEVDTYLTEVAIHISKA